MKFFLDTANIDEIRKAAKLGVIAGVTTNPTLIAKEGREFHPTIVEICSIISGPVSAEAVSLDVEGMLREARELAALAPNVVVKIPMTEAGLEAVSILAAEGTKTNVTLIFSANQALLAARAGATFVSPFVGRLDDISNPGMQVVKDIADIFAIHDIPAEIISASIRHPAHVLESALHGAHIATVPYKIIKQMIAHPLTEIGVAKFLEDWKSVMSK
jgi:transaldolase